MAKQNTSLGGVTSSILAAVIKFKGVEFVEKSGNRKTERVYSVSEMLM